MTAARYWKVSFLCFRLGIPQTHQERRTGRDGHLRYPTCKVIHPDQTYEGKQAFTFFAGISAENTGARGLCLHLVTIPPGGRAKAHLHEQHETALYVLQGEAGMWYGEHLQEHLIVQAGEFLYIPANVPHLPYNRSETDTCTAVIARTDPHEQESVVLLPDLDALH